MNWDFTTEDVTDGIERSKSISDYCVYLITWSMWTQNLGPKSWGHLSSIYFRSKNCKICQIVKRLPCQPRKPQKSMRKLESNQLSNGAGQASIFWCKSVESSRPFESETGSPPIHQASHTFTVNLPSSVTSVNQHCYGKWPILIYHLPSSKLTYIHIYGNWPIAVDTIDVLPMLFHSKRLGFQRLSRQAGALEHVGRHIFTLQHLREVEPGLSKHGAIKRHWWPSAVVISMVGWRNPVEMEVLMETSTITICLVVSTPLKKY